MTTEPTPMKKPEDEGAEKEDLFAEELDDIDLDALLEDDEEVDLLKDAPLALEEKTEASAKPPESDAGDAPEVFDDGEIDLLADDDEPLRAPPRAHEVQEEGLGMVADEGDAVRVDGSTNGRPPGSESEDILGVEESPIFDLLAEDDDQATKEVAPAAEPAANEEPEIDLLADEPAAEPAAPALAEETKESRAAQETVALTPAAGKKLGRFGGKGLKLGGKGKGAAKAEPAEEPAGAEEPEAASAKAAKRKLVKEKPKKEKKEKAVAAASAPPPAPRAARSTVPFVCSECYEEFLIPATYSQEMVSCPECLHVGKRPDADFLRTIHVHKSGERKSFALAVGVGAILLVLLVALIWMVSPYGGGSGGDGTMRMILLGASGLLAAVFVWLIVRFEGNRWEVYF